MEQITLIISTQLKNKAFLENSLPQVKDSKSKFKKEEKIWYFYSLKSGSSKFDEVILNLKINILVDLYSLKIKI